MKKNHKVCKFKHNRFNDIYEGYAFHERLGKQNSFHGDVANAFVKSFFCKFILLYF